jgi:molybdopterin-biosynthesis enzyme MoeA-like protein
VARTAAALVIGNEILTGKVQEANVAALATMLFELGISLRKVVVCVDDEATIADELAALARAHDVVVTSGGVGPTHDDVTVPAVARGLGRALLRDAGLEGRLRAHFGERTTPGHLRMAELPEGGELVDAGGISWPVIRVENVWVLPGVPLIFQKKLVALRERLSGDEAAFVSRAIYLRADEGEIAALLAQIEQQHPGVMVGSYPRFDEADHTVKVTFDGRDLVRVRAALEACLAGLPPERVVRSEI